MNPDENNKPENEAEQIGAFNYDVVEGEDKQKYQPDDPRSPADIDPTIIVSPDTRRDNRIPPGQARTRKWPVLHWGHVPSVSTDEWKLDVYGLVDNPFQLSWQQFQDLPQVNVFADFHCVTRWSRLDNVWQGVATQELLARSSIQAEARFVILHGYDGDFTTNLPLADFQAADALIAHCHDGEPLSPDHGGPVRAIVPQLYAWKSAKWLKAIELTAEDASGYWERAGYHDHGDPWLEERFG